MRLYSYLGTLMDIYIQYFNGNERIYRYYSIQESNYNYIISEFRFKTFPNQVMNDDSYMLEFSSISNDDILLITVSFSLSGDQI